MVEVGNLKEIRDGKGGIDTGGIIFIEREGERERVLSLSTFFGFTNHITELTT